MEVLYNTDAPIAGFQFNVTGAMVASASGGDAGDLGFSLYTGGGNNAVVGFSLEGATIPAGSGVLVVLEVEGDPAYVCIESVIMASPSGDGGSETLNSEVVDCLTISIDGGGNDIPGCTDMAACNYDADATVDDGSCD